MKKALILLSIVFGLSGCYINRTVVLDFPQTRQSFNYSCGPGAVQAVMAYYGENFRESELIELLKTDKNEGTLVKHITDFLNQKGFSTTVKQNMTTDELFSFIDKHIPVIVMLQAWGGEDDFENSYRDSWDDGHFAVVIGYTRKDVLLSDPALFTRGYIPVQEFIDRWHDYDEGETKTYQLGIAVYGKEPKFVHKNYERIK
ncbi:MAG: C39 family peptidase [Bacteroidales bacterium]